MPELTVQCQPFDTDEDAVNVKAKPSDTAGVFITAAAEAMGGRGISQATFRGAELTAGDNKDKTLEDLGLYDHCHLEIHFK